MASLAFLVTLLGVAAAVGGAWRFQQAGRRRVARAAMWIALAPVFLLMGAPLVASVAVGTAVAAWLLDARPATETELMDQTPKWRRWMGRGAWLLLAFVTIGTLARQVVTHGATISERPDYGAHNEVLSDWVSMSWPVLGLVVLWVMFAALDRREREREGLG